MPKALTRNQQKWVDALRSGKYTQATGALEIAGDRGNCCLGVACRLAEDDLKLKIDVVQDDHLKTTVVSFNGEHSLLPKDVQDWLGLRTNDGETEIEDEEGNTHNISLADMNDGGAKFTEIADFIEKYPEALFV